MPELIAPSNRYKESYIAAIREFHTEGRYEDLDIAWLNDHFDDFVAALLQKKVSAAPGRVLETILWLVDGDEFIGRVGIRHELNDFLETFGGHIGYDVRPSQRKRGYGTLMLKLALDEARAIGIKRALLTCDSTNVASRKIIEAGGGQFQDEQLLNWRDVPTQRWWIDL